MAWNKFLGDCQGRAQVTTLTPANVQIDDVFTVTCNGKDVSFAATVATVANVVAGLIDAITAAAELYPEFTEFTATAGTADAYVILTGLSDGTPFTVTTSTGNGGVLGVTITTLVTGTAGRNEKQRVICAGPPTGGTFTMTFAGQTTGAVAYNASGATLTTALEALSNIAPGDVVVTKNSTGDYTLEFAGVYAATDVPLLTGNGASLTGSCSVSVVTTTNGSAGLNEIQRVTLNTTSMLANGITGYTLNLNGYESAEIFYSGGPYGVQAALEGMANIGAGNVAVEVETGGDPYTGPFRVTFRGALANQNINEMTCNTVYPPGYFGTNTGYITVTTAQDGSSSAVNEVQVLTLLGGPSGGTFTVTFQGQTTAGVAYSASAATLQTALEALSNIAPSDVTVTGSAGGPYTCTFGGVYVGVDVQQMTGSGASLTGANVNASTTQTSIAAANEQQQVTLTGGPTAGTFTLSFNSEGPTSAIAFDATSATVQAALEGLTTPVPGDIAVVGAAGGPWIVTFQGAYLHTDVPAMTGNGASLTSVGSQTLAVATTTTPTGKFHFDNAENWSLGSVPVDGQNILFADLDSTRGCYYGLVNPTITPTAIYIDASCEGQVGLDDYTENGYYEYRPKDLTLGDAGSIDIFCGRGAGECAQLIRINTGAAKFLAYVYNGRTLGGQNAKPSIRLKCDVGIASEVSVSKGAVAVAYSEEETSGLAKAKMAFVDDRDRDAVLILGLGVAGLLTISKLGGELELNCAVATSFEQLAGETTVQGSGDVALLYGRGGTIYWNSVGDILGASRLSGDCILDMSRDQRVKQATGITIYGDTADISDPAKILEDSAVAGQLTLIYKETTRFRDTLGSNVTIVRSNT